jgi:CubicO group peptidase (beta-lactamase class C family)
VSLPAADSALRGRLRTAVRSVPAPDVVFGCSRNGAHTVVTGGTKGPGGGHDAAERAALRSEIGSATKTYTGLLLAVLVHEGLVRYERPARRPSPALRRPP